jgi:hypothetical protein
MQSKEILLNLSTYAQGSKVIIVVVQLGAVKIYVAGVEALRKKNEGVKLSLPPKLVEQLVSVSVISFCKISFPVKNLMPYYAEIRRSRPLIARLYS